MNRDITSAVPECQIESIAPRAISPLPQDYFPAYSVEPLRTKSLWTPDVLDQSRSTIQVTLAMPVGVRRCDIDHDELPVFYPGKIRAQHFTILQTHLNDSRQIYITASFDKSQCLDNLHVGFNDIEIAGRFTSGRYFCAETRLYVPARQDLKPLTFTASS